MFFDLNTNTVKISIRYKMEFETDPNINCIAKFQKCFKKTKHFLTTVTL